MAVSSITNLKLEAAMQERVERLARARQQAPDALMVEAIKHYVDREEKRAQYLSDGISSWEHYQETGLHLTGPEMDAWLAKLANGEDAPPPECHV